MCAVHKEDIGDAIWYRGLKQTELHDDSVNFLISDWLEVKFSCWVVMLWADWVISLEPGEEDFQ